MINSKNFSKTLFPKIPPASPETKHNKQIKNDDFEKLLTNYFNNEDVLTNNMDDISYKLLDSLVENYKPIHALPAYEFDLVIGGGGLKGYYICGAMEVLKKMMKLNLIKIRNYTGTSAGAIMAVYMVCNISLHKVRNSYEFARLNSSKNDLNNILLKVADKFLPDDAHILCNDKVHIVLSELTLFGFKETIVNQYESREHLLKVLSATCHIPYITSKKISGVRINGKTYYDGGFVKNIPVKSNNDLPQLVFQTISVEYASGYMFRLIDKCPELLIIRGAIEMEKFISDMEENKNSKGRVSKRFPIKWYEPNTDESNNLYLYLKYTSVMLTLIFVMFVKFIKSLKNNL